MRRAVLAVCGCLCLLLAWILRPILQEKDSKSSSLGEGQLTLRTETEAESASNSIHFLEHRSADSGVSFFYAGGPSSWHKMTEQNGGGIAAFDADSDGQLDLFCVNGMPPEEPQHAELFSKCLTRKCFHQ